MFEFNISNFRSLLKDIVSRILTRQDRAEIRVAAVVDGHRKRQLNTLRTSAAVFQYPVRSAVAAIALGTTLVACSDTTVATRSFEETESFTVPGGILTGFPLALDNIPIPVNLAEQDGYDEGDFDFVTSVRVRDIVFEIAPESNDAGVDTVEDGNPDSFEFVSSLSMSLRAMVDGVETNVPIADLPANDPQIASNTTSLVMNVSDEVNIRDLIEAPGGPDIILSISGTIPPDAVQVNARIRFRVGVGFR